MAYDMAEEPVGRKSQRKAMEKKVHGVNYGETEFSKRYPQLRTLDIARRAERSRMKKTK